LARSLAICFACSNSFLPTNICRNEAEMSKTNTEKITKEILEGLSEDTGDSDSYDVDSGGEDSEDRP
jgi:hypothetical protein